MSTTTIKRIQFHKEYFVTVENTNVEVSDTPGDGVTIRLNNSEKWPSIGTVTNSIGLDQEHALALRDALNELFPV